MDAGQTRTNNSIFSSKSSRKLILPGALIVIVLLVIIMFALRKSGQTSSLLPTNSGDKVTVDKAKSTQTLDKEYAFSLKDANGKEVSKIKYKITTVEKRDEIIVKGQKATLVDGRTFLVINLRITNNYDKPLQINARDYLRLIINNNTDKLAPDIHNDPVDVQPLSTKETRVAFPIDDKTKSLVLQVGELVGKKETVTLSL